MNSVKSERVNISNIIETAVEIALKKEMILNAHTQFCSHAKQVVTKRTTDDADIRIAHVCLWSLCFSILSTAE